MKKRSKQPESIANILNQSLKKQGRHANSGNSASSESFWKKIQGYLIFNDWDKIVGDQIARHCRPLRFVRNTLYLKATHPTWQNELKMMEPNLVKKIREYDPQTPVTKLKFLN